MGTEIELILEKRIAPLLLLILLAFCISVYHYARYQMMQPTIISCGYLKGPRTTAISIDNSVSISALAFSADSNLIAAGNTCGIIRLWNVQTGEYCGSIAAHRSSVTNLTFDSCRRCISAGGDGDIKFWDISTSEGRLLFKLKNSSGIQTMALSPTGHFLATGDRAGNISQRQCNDWRLEDFNRKRSLSHKSAPNWIR